MFGLFGVKGRIGTLFRIYRTASHMVACVFNNYFTKLFKVEFEYLPKTLNLKNSSRLFLGVIHLFKNLYHFISEQKTAHKINP